MSTTLVVNRKRGANIADLSAQQEMFCLEMTASVRMNPTEAARKAGYKRPSDAGYRLMKLKKIKAFLGKCKREREERTKLTADNVIEYLRTALFLEPLKYFRPYKGGKWEVRDPDNLPTAVGQLIETMEVVTVTDREGDTTERILVTIVTKTVVLGLAMKHLNMFPDKMAEVLGKMALDYDQLYLRKGNGQRALEATSEPVDPIEERLSREENDG